MQAQGMRVDDNIPIGLKICHHTLPLIRLELSEDQIQLLHAVGCSQFSKWSDDITVDQRELTVGLEDEQE
jgi:hypothetical protein